MTFDSGIVGFKPDSLFHIWLGFGSSHMNRESGLTLTLPHQITYNILYWYAYTSSHATSCIVHLRLLLSMTSYLQKKIKWKCQVRLCFFNSCQTLASCFLKPPKKWFAQQNCRIVQKITSCACWVTSFGAYTKRSNGKTSSNNLGQIKKTRHISD